MLEIETAPFLELEDYKPPEGIKCIYLKMEDGKRIRLAYWKKNNQDSNRACVLLQQGHNEFIEKYFETIQELIDRNLDVICYDWRGQGMSDRMIDDVNKQYIEDFNIHSKDLNYILNNFIEKEFSKPLITIAHSMGGHIILSFSKEVKIFKGIILSAPMLGFKFEPFLFWLTKFASFFYNKEDYFIGSKPNMGKETDFEENTLTSDYNRYKRTQKLVRKNPNIRLWGVSNAWVIAVKKSLLEMRKKNWAESLDNNFLVINPVKDKVVNSKKTLKMSKRLPNCRVINVKDSKHEILMEKNELREIFWNNFDIFLKKIKI
tara:strand:- start:25557 stop:26510 length:954 start_codon:yes stop_codon:yes gene_type:complete